jgi:rubredoxin
MRYRYQCSACAFVFEKDLPMDNRDEPIDSECPECGTVGEVKRKWEPVSFNVPYGSCGNADNGYSSYFGDTKEFKKMKDGMGDE